jgi:hypothetical protein
LFLPARPLQMVCGFLCALEIEKKNKAKKEKVWKEKKKELSINVNSTKHKKTLQDEINKLARFIDLKFYDTCVDCELPLKDQIHGSHYHNVGGNEHIRFNLHNIHASTLYCNKFNHGNKVGYLKKLAERFNKDYANFIDELNRDYKGIKISKREIYEAIPVVRKLIRDLDTLEFDSAIKLRDYCNNKIGYYKTYYD